MRFPHRGAHAAWIVINASGFFLGVDGLQAFQDRGRDRVEALGDLGLDLCRGFRRELDPFLGATFDI